MASTNHDDLASNTARPRIATSLTTSVLPEHSTPDRLDGSSGSSPATARPSRAKSSAAAGVPHSIQTDLGAAGDGPVTGTGSAYEKLPLTSPCFVHAHLDSSLHEYVRNRDAASTDRRRASSTKRARPKVPAPAPNGPTGPSGTPRRNNSSASHLQSQSQALRTRQPSIPSTASPRITSAPDSSDSGEEGSTEGEDEEPESLTRQLAETATSVREMSKQLGRARVKGAVQSVLIITKARDNHLIRLTRELAIWLMSRQNSGERPMVVYVDHQLRKSKRFDLAGLQSEHPEFFRPLGSRHPHQRRYSRKDGSVSSGLNGYGSSAAMGSGSSSSGHPHHRQNSGSSSTSSAPTSVSGGAPHSAHKSHFRMTKVTPTSTGTPSKDEAHAGQPPAPSFSTGPGSEGSSYGGERAMANGHEGQLRYWTAAMCTEQPELFDFVVTLGGDGTVLFASWLFQRVVPPVIPFALGSLGFLTNFDFDHYPQVMDQVIDSGVRVNLRMRFTCTVYRAVEPLTDDKAPDAKERRRAIRSGKTGEIFMQRLGEDGWEGFEEDGSTRLEKLQRAGAGMSPAGRRAAEVKSVEDKEIMCFHTKPMESFEVLNELVVDRGPSPYVSLLELFGDEHHMTTVQADGLTVSTPTGSTAYSLSAGGSLVHPEIPAILITPICPHTLSFRPMLLPDSMELRICVPYNSRSTAWASFDGRGRVELRQGDHIKVTASRFPMPTVCADKQSTDWFEAISRTLKWNERQRQKSFVVVEQGAEQTQVGDADRKGAEAAEAAMEASQTENGMPDEEKKEIGAQDEDDDEEFDIDDESSEAAGEDGLANHRKSEKGRPHGLIDFTPDKAHDESRFRDPAPHPPKLSSRHRHRDRLLASDDDDDADGERDYEAESRARGDVGDRDDLRESLESKSRHRKARSRLLPKDERSPGGTETDETHRPRPARVPSKVKAKQEELRAFVVRGQDTSDASLSGTE